MVSQKYHFLLTILVWLTALNVMANDTAYGSRNGTIELLQTKDISIEYEILYISPTLITVDYLFKNKSNQDITVDVAFPMPPAYFGMSDYNPVKNYSLYINNKEVSPILKSIFKTKSGVDITEEMIGYGWTKTELMEYIEESYLSNGSYIGAHKISPRWIIEDSVSLGLIIQDYYTWTQTFPAGELIHIKHQYEPSYTSGVPRSVGEILKSFSYDNDNFNFCLESDKQIELDSKLDKDHQGYEYAIVDYILTTANNWDGPIKHFNLIIDKSNKDSLVFLCFDGKLKRETPTQFSFNAIDFIPKEDLSILFLKR
ncbi:DUF4424 family protein [Thorsellia anophelis]|uniref:DUF4424 domain-containing protein n=1 Tax=Thorsellia anophelis DSM 18579 TaxID=1123402 RepID=A0A1I0CAH3_9GAMM|nr:DUF4424 family protein [Thorsellia anophelis]SET16262.1 protein of unknown function [Thorsellia anophelis DSM 18579]